jgi:hypothetical protein
VSTPNSYGHGGKGNGWKAMWSSHVHRSPMQKGCCVILWLRPVKSSCVPLAPFEFPHFFLSLFLQYLP